MGATNPSALHLLVPDYPLDQIIGYFTGTATVGAGGISPTVVTTPLPHGFGDSCYFQGIYSIDGGTTYNDFGSMTPDLSSPSTPIFQTFGCNATSDVTNANVIMFNYTSSSITCIYKIFLIAKNTMAHPVNPLSTNQILSFSSLFNFQEIAYKGSLTLNVPLGSVGSTSFIHNLGYIPKIRAFWFDASSPTVCNSILYSPGLSPHQQAGLDSIQVQLTNTTLTFVGDEASPFGTAGLNGTIEYRIYLGNGS